MATDNTPARRTELINLRFLPQDVITLQDMADKKGLPLSTFCYLIIKDMIDDETNQKSS